MIKSLIVIVVFLSIYAAILEKKHEWILLISGPSEQLLDVNPEKKERLKKMMNLLMKELMQAFYCSNTDLKKYKDTRYRWTLLSGPEVINNILVDINSCNK